MAALRSLKIPCQTSQLFKPAPWSNKRKIPLKAVKSLHHCIQCEKFRLTWNNSSLGLIMFIMASDLQVESQQSASVNGRYSPLHSRQKAICSFYTVVCRIMILFTLFSTFHMKNFKFFANSNSYKSLCGTFYLPFMDKWGKSCVCLWTRLQKAMVSLFVVMPNHGSGSQYGIENNIYPSFITMILSLLS